MASEGLWEDLMDMGEKEDYLCLLKEYGDQLQPRFPDRFQEAYTRQLRREMEAYSSRQEYRKAIRKLKQLANYQGGEIPAAELAEEWKKHYFRRPALLDELKKAGF